MNSSLHEVATDENLERWAMVTGLSRHTLDDSWFVQPVERFRQGFYLSDQGTWIELAVPAHWQQCERLSDYAGRVVYRHHFSVPPAMQAANGSPPRRVWLRVNGSFYWTEPYLNGSSLGRYEGYFAPHEYDITDLLNESGINTLLLEVECPDEHDKYGKRMITGVFSHWDCFDPAANPGGVWLPVELLTSGPARVRDVCCSTETYSAEVAQLRYSAEVDSAIAGPVRLRWTLEPRTFEGSAQIIEQRHVLRQGRQQISGLFKLREPRLWWTHDLGRPDLYTVTLELLVDNKTSDQYRFLFGVRQFELRDWIPYLNGTRFLIKGNNYAPGDMRIATMTRERCQQDLELARQCNMNMLRVHAHVDHPALYHAADEAGMLLWQDMPLQWIYHVEVLPEARRQARAMIRLLFNHPSIGVWCMHNEPVFVSDTADETLVTRIRTYGSTFGFSWNRDVLDTQLKHMSEREDPQRPVVRSSGEFFVPYWKSGTDSHAYFGWYSSYGTLADAENLRQHLPRNLRFVTEFGTQSFPNHESCVKFMPADINEIDFAHLEQRHSFQAEVMEKWIPWHEATSLEELIEMTQDYQIFINRYYIDRLRYHKYRPTGGIVPFVFLDPYPAVLWSIIDYWRVPKRSYAAMRMAFSPQYAFSVFMPRLYRLNESIDLPLYVVNDAQHAVSGVHLATSLRNPSGSEIAHVEHTLTLEPDCMAQEVDRLRLTPTLRGSYTLHIDLTGVEQETHQVYDIDVG